MERSIVVTNSWKIDRASDSDETLVTRIARKDRSSLDTLYLRHATPLLGFLLQITGERGLAEEVLQDTFLAAWQSAARFQHRSSVKTWLYGIARRQAHNALRRKNLDVTDDAALNDLPSDDPEPEATALSNVEREVVADAIARLGRTQREILTLAFAQDLSYPEMAEILDVPIGTIKSRLSNAKRLLRQILETAETE